MLPAAQKAASSTVTNYSFTVRLAMREDRALLGVGRLINTGRVGYVRLPQRRLSTSTPRWVKTFTLDRQPACYQVLRGHARKRVIVSVNADITTWLDGIGLARYATAFTENAID